MVFKLSEIVRKYKKELFITITLGITFNFNVSINFSGNIALNLSTCIIVLLGYHFVKTIIQKH